MRVSVFSGSSAAFAFCIGAAVATASPVSGTLGPPQPIEMSPRGFYTPTAHHAADRPHPAVARIVVPEGNTAISYGSGTLIDVRDQFGLVVTNWHVVRDGTGEVEVVFPDGFRSKARPLKVDSDWDLAALVIWRPQVEPVAIAAVAPQPGDQLTICGYGAGQYRAATGRCTQYYAPSLDLPQHMVELDVEARQGDSGGPIFNDRGELAGVLFGAGRGTTLGSFGGRVGSFLGTLAPDIGRKGDRGLVQHGNGAPPAVLRVSGNSGAMVHAPENPLATPETTAESIVAMASDADALAQGQPASQLPDGENGWRSVTATNALQAASGPAPGSDAGAFFAHSKNMLAVVGVVALTALVLRAVR